MVTIVLNLVSWLVFTLLRLILLPISIASKLVLVVVFASTVNLLSLFLKVGSLVSGGGLTQVLDEGWYNIERLYN